MTNKMAKMEKDFRAEIERLQNVIDVTNQIIEERQVGEMKAWLGD